MVARGDLGVDVPLEEVPHIQKEVIRQARAARVPVIVATQMLESMTTHARPTRAEVADVTAAIFDGADAIMLSAETASGRFPAQAVDYMARIAARAEGRPSSGAPRRGATESPGFAETISERGGHRGARPRRPRHRGLHRDGVLRAPDLPGAARRAHHRPHAAPGWSCAASRSAGA